MQTANLPNVPLCIAFGNESSLKIFLHFQMRWDLLGNLCNNLVILWGDKLSDCPRDSWIDLIFLASWALEEQSKKSWISFLHASSRNSFCFQQAIIIDISVIQVASPFSLRRFPTRLAKIRGLLGFSIGFPGFANRARRPRRLGVALWALEFLNSKYCWATLGGTSTDANTNFLQKPCIC